MLVTMSSQLGSVLLLFFLSSSALQLLHGDNMLESMTNQMLSLSVLGFSPRFNGSGDKKVLKKAAAAMVLLEKNTVQILLKLGSHFFYSCNVSGKTTQFRFF
jgi:hypothetical protein